MTSAVDISHICSATKHVDDAKSILVFRDLDRAVDRNVVKCLAGTAGGPGDLERVNGGGLADSDGQRERVAAVARPTGDLAVSRDHAARRVVELDANSAPMAARLVFVPTSRTVSQWLPWPGF